jgi:hypothetical protein
MFDDLLSRAMVALPRVMANRVLTQFEPEKDVFYTRRGHVGAITRLVKAAKHDELKLFTSPKELDDFLWSAFRYLRLLGDHEEILVALGQRPESPAGRVRLDGLWRCVGTRSESSFTPLSRQIIDQQVCRIHGGCAIIVHNHAPYDVRAFLKLFFGWTPLPSSKDREIALAGDMAMLRRWVATGHEGTLRWYLVEEDRMREFFLPSVERFQRVLEYICVRDASSIDWAEAARILLL